MQVSKKERDVLLISRPDHSLQIYDALKCQDSIDYTFITFKVVPSWLKKLLFNWKRLRSVGSEVIISVKCTILNLLRYKFRLRFAQNFSEENIMQNEVRRLLKKNTYKVIHYWPLYVFSEVEVWAQSNPDKLVIADVHFPNPEVVINEMMPVYTKYGLDFTSTVWPRHLKVNDKILSGAPSFMVPSEYVANTYKVTYPNKQYHIVTYGITVSPRYAKIKRIAIRNFVFAGGTISLEKGCDLLFEYFTNHPELSLHVYGECVPEQEYIFSKYYEVENILFHGHINKEELPEHLPKYDVGIHLSRFDAYSLSVGEIIGCGLPVVVSNMTGIASEVQKYNWGIVTDLSNHSISTAINQICNLDIYNTYVEFIDTYIMESHKSYGEKMLDFYQSIVDGEVNI